MKLKVNPFLLGCALLMVLSHFLLPLAKITLPVVHVALIRLTAPMLGTVAGDWMAVPLVLAVLMVLAALFDSPPVSIAAGALAFVGMLALGLSLNAIVASSDLSKLMQWAGNDVLKLSVDAGSVTNFLSAAMLRLALGFYAYLLLAVVYVALCFAEQDRRSVRGGGGFSAPGGGPGRQAGGMNDNEARRKALYK